MSFNSAIREVASPALKNRGYEFDSERTEGRMVTFSKSLGDLGLASIEFQRRRPAAEKKDWDFKINLIRRIHPRAEQSDGTWRPLYASLSNLMKYVYGAASDDQLAEWFRAESIEELRSELTENLTLLFDFGIPWLESKDSLSPGEPSDEITKRFHSLVDELVAKALENRGFQESHQQHPARRIFGRKVKEGKHHFIEFLLGAINHGSEAIVHVSLKKWPSDNPDNYSNGIGEIIPLKLLMMERASSSAHARETDWVCHGADALKSAVNEAMNILSERGYEWLDD